MADPRIAAILDRSGDPGIVAWAHEGQGRLAALADPELAIAGAAAVGNVRVLQSVTEPKALRKLAAAALHRLKSTGVKVADAPQPKSFTLAREVLEVPPRAFLSPPSALGNSHLVLTATDHEGSCIMELIIGGEKVEDHHGHATRGELRSFWKEMESDPAMREVPFVAGLHLADLVCSGRRAHGWDHFLSKVAPTTLASARLVDPLRHALEAVPENNGSFVLPAWLVPAAVVAELVEELPQMDEAEGVRDEWVEQAAERALTAEGRAALAVGADRSALVFGLVGDARQAARARDVAAALRAGQAGSSLPEVKSAVLVALFSEVQHRQAEKDRDLEALMRRMGQQGE